MRIHLFKFGYAPVPCTSALRKHTTRDIPFSLIVNDFGIKSVGKENADHMIKALKKQCTIYMDWTGSLLCGLHIQWDYTASTCDILMPDYLKEALHKFQQPKRPRPQNAPHAWKACT